MEGERTAVMVNPSAVNQQEWRGQSMPGLGWAAGPSETAGSQGAFICGSSLEGLDSV